MKCYYILLDSPIHSKQGIIRRNSKQINPITIYQYELNIGCFDKIQLQPKEMCVANI